MGNGGGGGGRNIGTGTARGILRQRGGGLTTRLNRERNVNAPRRAARAARRG